jgi:small subunit ribosomal protein S9
MSETKYFYGVGRRKACTARAKVYEATELTVFVNGKKLEEYFPSFYQLTITEMLSKVGLKDAKIELFINGGGVTGQSDAARLAIANALLKKDDEGFRPAIRANGYNTTDIRKVLAKQAGRPKARKSRQWVKR